MREVNLPLKWATPGGWAEGVLREPLALLNDHAHLEKKAAGNALEMLHRWPEPNGPVNWVEAMTAVARDEVEHLAVVCRILARRGGRLTKNHRNPYALALHGLVRVGRGREDLVDRLLISGLIEARSCERFWLLAEACAGRDKELAHLYKGLWGSEHGHFRTFVQLAEGVMEKGVVARRWEEMLEAEGEIIRRQEPGARMHGGVG